MDNNTSIVIDLAGRYAAAFGIVKASEMMSAAVLTKEDNQYSVDFFDDFDEQDEFVSIQDYGGNNLLTFGQMLVDNVENVFAPPMMMEFRREKDLIETETNGEDNVIVERWATKPWEIRMRGVLINVEERKYPKEHITQLHNVFRRNETLMVLGEQFYDKDIKRIYLKDISIIPLEGFGDTIQFELTASSINENNWTLIKPDDS